MTTRPSPATIALIAGLLLNTAGVRSTAAQDDSAHDLMKRVLDSAPKVAFTSKMKLSSQGGMERDLELSHKKIGEANVSYMEVTAPFNLKDTRFLSIDRTNGPDEQFIYVPVAKRSIQVSDESRKQAFLGSDFSVSDFVAPELDAFTYTFTGESDVNGRHVRLVQAVPKNAEKELYSKLTFAVDPKELVIVRTEMFDKAGKLLKVWTVEQLDKIDGVWTPKLQKMVNVQDNTESKIELNEIKYNAQIGDDIFSKAHLDR